MRRFSFVLAVTVLLALVEASRVAADALVPGQTVQAGKIAEVQVELSNATSVSHAYGLAVDGLPATFRATFVQDGPILDTLSLPAGAEARVTLRVAVPADTRVGRYAATVVTTRDDGDVLSMPIALDVENTYAVKIVSQNLNVTTFRGQVFTIDVTAANTGAAPLTGISLALGTPAKWIVQIEPASVASLAPGAEATFRATVSVPRSQVAIDQPVPLSIQSDQTRSPDGSLVVRVQNAPGYLWGAGAVILSAAVGVVLYFRARGRR